MVTEAKDYPQIAVVFTYDELIEQLETLLHKVKVGAVHEHEDLSLDPIEYGLRFALHEAKRARKADDLLRHTPVSYRWPDGNPVRLPMPASNVLALADAFGPNVRRREAAEIAQRIRDDMRAYPKRQCGRSTQSGHECRAWALAYIEEPTCHNHANTEERNANRKCKRIEEQRLQEALRRLPETDPADYALMTEVEPGTHS